MSDAPENSRTLGNVLEDIEQAAAAGADMSGYIRELADMALFSAHRIEALAAENARLREALKRLVAAQDCGAPDTDPIHPDIWRKARAALSDQPRQHMPEGEHGDDQPRDQE